MFQDPTVIAISGGTGIAGWSVSGESGPSSVTATALLVAGPTTGEAGVASEPFVVSANGSLPGSVAITPHVSGGTGNFSPSSQTITTGQVAQFTFTPNAAADYTITFTNNAALTNPDSSSYASVSPAPPPIDVSTHWLIDLNPSRAFNASQGSVPANTLLPTDKHGRAQSLRSLVQLCSDPALTVYDWSNAMTDATTLVVNGGTVISRVADPNGSGKTVYKRWLNKTTVNWPAYPANRMRTDSNSGNSVQYEPFGGRHWIVHALYLPAAWHNLLPFNGNTEYALFFDWHDEGGSLIGGTPASIEWSSGNGNPANSAFMLRVRSYNNPQWPEVQSKGPYKLVVDYKFPAMTDDWVYFIWDICAGVGVADYPNFQPGNWGAPSYLYGPVGADRTAYIKLYAAYGETGVAQLIYNYQGFWNGPYATNATAAIKARGCGYAQDKMYMKTTFNAASGDDRIMYSRGYVQWRADDVPAGVSAAQMLAAFKALR